MTKVSFEEQRKYYELFGGAICAQVLGLSAGHIRVNARTKGWNKPTQDTILRNTAQHIKGGMYR